MGKENREGKTGNNRVNLENRYAKINEKYSNYGINLEFCTGKLKQTTIFLRQDIRKPYRDSNPISPEYKSRLRHQ